MPNGPSGASLERRVSWSAPPAAPHSMRPFASRSGFRKAESWSSSRTVESDTWKNGIGRTDRDRDYRGRRPRHGGSRARGFPRGVLRLPPGPGRRATPGRGSETREECRGGGPHSTIRDRSAGTPPCRRRRPDARLGLGRDLPQPSESSRGALGISPFSREPMVCLRHCGRHRRNREDDHRVAARRDERTVLARGDRRPRNEGPFPRIPEKEVALTLFKVDLKNGVRDSYLHSSESRFHSIFTGGRSLSITPYWATKDGERSHPHPDPAPAVRGQSERGAGRGGERS